MGLGCTGLVGRQLTSVVGDVGLRQVTAGDERRLGFAEVLKPGFGYGGQHRAGAVRHTGVCEQPRCGAPIGVPHLVAHLWIEAGIAAEGRAGETASRVWVQPAATGRSPDLTYRLGGPSSTCLLGILSLEWAAHTKHREQVWPTTIGLPSCRHLATQQGLREERKLFQGWGRGLGWAKAQGSPLVWKALWGFGLFLPPRRPASSCMEPGLWRQFGGLLVGDDG